jgi:hypothetical protein
LARRHLRDTLSATLLTRLRLTLRTVLAAHG